jgi:hypothetical protein
MDRPGTCIILDKKYNIAKDLSLTSNNYSSVLIKKMLELLTKEAKLLEFLDKMSKVISCRGFICIWQYIDRSVTQEIVYEP